MQVVLELKTGVLGGEKIYLTVGQSVTVGRSETARFPIPTDGQLSSLHFEVICNENDCLLIDLDSTNGTRLNGETVGDSALRDGDQIAAGQSIFDVAIRTNDDIFDSAIEEVPSEVQISPPVQPETKFDRPDSEFESEALDTADSVPGTINLTSDDGFDIRVIPGNSITIGRTERSDYAITHDGHMSGLHFAVLNDGARPRVRDERSTNGTRLNGTPVSEQELNSGDVITAGRTEFHVTINVEEPHSPSSSPDSATAGEIPTAKVLVAADTETSPRVALNQESSAKNEPKVDEPCFESELDDLGPEATPSSAGVEGRHEEDSRVNLTVGSEPNVSETPSDELEVSESLTNEFPTQPIPNDADDCITDTPVKPPEQKTDEISLHETDSTSTPSEKVASAEEINPSDDENKTPPISDPSEVKEPVETVEPNSPRIEQPTASVASEIEEVAAADAQPVCNSELKIVIVEYATSDGESHQFWLTPNQLTIVGSGEQAHERIQTDSQIKDRHFALATDEKACRITDLESSGTFVNDNQVATEYVLNEDIIRAGATTFKIQVVGGIEQVKRFN